MTASAPERIRELTQRMLRKKLYVVLSKGGAAPEPLPTPASSLTTCRSGLLASRFIACLPVPQLLGCVRLLVRRRRRREARRGRVPLPRAAT